MRKSALNKVTKMVCKIEDIVADLEYIIEAEQEYYDGRSESWQEGEDGEAFSDRIYAIEELKDALDNAVYEVNDMLENNL